MLWGGTHLQAYSGCWVLAKSLQSCLTLCDLIGCSLPNSSVHGILQARILEWVAMSSSRESSPLRDQTHISDVSCISRWVLYHFTTWEAHIQVAGRIHFLLCRTKAPLPCWLSAQLSDSSRWPSVSCHPVGLYMFAFFKSCSIALLYWMN